MYRKRLHWVFPVFLVYMLSSCFLSGSLQPPAWTHSSALRCKYVHSRPFQDALSPHFRALLNHELKKGNWINKWTLILIKKKHTLSFKCWKNRWVWDILSWWDDKISFEMGLVILAVLQPSCSLNPPFPFKLLSNQLLLLLIHYTSTWRNRAPKACTSVLNAIRKRKEAAFLPFFFFPQILRFTRCILKQI